jgi:hypothetical protein
VKLVEEYEIVYGKSLWILPGSAESLENRFEEPVPPVVGGDCSGWFQLRFLLPNDTRAMLHGAAGVKRGAERPEAGPSRHACIATGSRLSSAEAGSEAGESHRLAWP